MLTLAGFYAPPFTLKAEELVQLVLADSEEVLQGRLDVLGLKEQVWVVVLESKKTALSVWSALPQTLTYLMANPDLAKPSFGLMTNGGSSVFVKLSQVGESQVGGNQVGENQVEGNQYDVSRVFAALTSMGELEGLLQGLKRLSLVAQD